MKDIIPKKEYSLQELVKLSVMGKSHATVLRRVLEDRMGANLLKVVVGGSVDARRYKVKGSCLVSYLKKI